MGIPVIDFPNPVILHLVAFNKYLSSNITSYLFSVTIDNQNIGFRIG